MTRSAHRNTITVNALAFSRCNSVLIVLCLAGIRPLVQFPVPHTPGILACLSTEEVEAGKSQVQEHCEGLGVWGRVGSTQFSGGKDRQLSMSSMLAWFT